MLEARLGDLISILEEQIVAATDSIFGRCNDEMQTGGDEGGEIWVRRKQRIG